MTDSTGWELYKERTVRRQALIIELWTYIFFAYNEQETPRGLDDFPGSMGYVVTEEEFEQLYASLWKLVHKYWQLENKPNLALLYRDVSDEWAKLSFPEVIEAINNFSIEVKN